MPKNKRTIYLILHNIRSLHNVGSIFRSADAFGVTKIFLSGYTPTPDHHRVSQIHKTALGAQNIISWEKFLQPTRLIKRLQHNKVRVVALETGSNSRSLASFKPHFPLALILGNEVTGLSKSILSAADTVVKIPMLGQKESLNVSVAAGVVLYTLTS